MRGVVSAVSGMFRCEAVSGILVVYSAKERRGLILLKETKSRYDYVYFMQESVLLVFCLLLFLSVIVEVGVVVVDFLSPLGLSAPC